MPAPTSVLLPVPPAAFPTPLPRPNSAFGLALADELVSIVVPLYNEQDSVRPLAEQIAAVMQTHGLACEPLLVNDGRADNTWVGIAALAAENPVVVGIDLAGNYGQTLSLRAGFERARGTIIVAMDGAKAKRPEGATRSLLANTAHKLISTLSGVQLEYFGATYKAYRSYLLRNVELLGDAHRFLGALVARKDIRYREFPVERLRFTSGSSGPATTASARRFRSWSIW